MSLHVTYGAVDKWLRGGHPLFLPASAAHGALSLGDLYVDDEGQTVADRKWKREERRARGRATAAVARKERAERVAERYRGIEAAARAEARRLTSWKPAEETQAEKEVRALARKVKAIEAKRFVSWRAAQADRKAAG